MPEIVLLGLGPGDPKLMTCEASELLAFAKKVYRFGNMHPAYRLIPDKVECISLQGTDGSSLENDLETIFSLDTDQDELILVFPGDPLMDSIFGRLLCKVAKDREIPITVIPGVGLLSTGIQLVDTDRSGSLVLVDSRKFIQRNTPEFPPNLPAMITSIDDAEIAMRVGKVLRANYPEDHAINLINLLRKENIPERILLNEIDANIIIEFGSIFYIPPLSEHTAFESFQEVVARLRAPDGCPWDREQTHLSLRRHLLEESYETLEAMDSENMRDLKEELGDLLLQIVLNAQIAFEEGYFKMSDVLLGINEKLVSRHPHVFGNIQVDGVGGVLKNWEILKEKERLSNGNSKKGLLDGAPASLPALAYAHEIQDRAARVGFDWPEVEGVIAKVREELEEVLSAPTMIEQEKEIGDLLFAVVNLARWLKVDPESALRDTNKRFKKRFTYIEESAHKRNISLADLSFKEMDHLWEQAKDLE